MATIPAAATGTMPARPSPDFGSTLSTMREVLVRRFGIEGEVSEGSEIATLGLDSLAIVEYGFELEKELGILLPDIPTGLATVGELARFVHAQVEKTASGDAAQ